MYQPVIQTSGGTDCTDDNGSSVDKAHNEGFLDAIMPQLNNADREQLSFYSTNIHRLNKSTLFPSFSLQKSLKWKIVSASESLMLIYSRGVYTALALEGSQFKSDEVSPF